MEGTEDPHPSAIISPDHIEKFNDATSMNMLVFVGVECMLGPFSFLGDTGVVYHFQGGLARTDSPSRIE